MQADASHPRKRRASEKLVADALHPTAGVARACVLVQLSFPSGSPAHALKGIGPRAMEKFTTPELLKGESDNCGDNKVLRNFTGHDHYMMDRAFSSLTGKLRYTLTTPGPLPL